MCSSEESSSLSSKCFTVLARAVLSDISISLVSKRVTSKKQEQSANKSFVSAIEDLVESDVDCFED